MRRSQLRTERSESRISPQTSQRRILLIEDDPDHQLLERKALASLGPDIEIHVVGDALAGLQALKEKEFDLVIADYQMPQIDGLSFLKTINEYKIAVPLVLVTGLGNERVAVQALKEGAYDYVVKETGYLELLPSVAERAISLFTTRRQLEEAQRRLKESEERYRELVHNLHAIVWEADLFSGRFEFVSQAAETILGYPPGRWMEDPRFRLSYVHPEERSRAEQLWAAAARDKTDYVFEYRARSASGTQVWLRDVVRVVEGEEGGKLRGLTLDITEQKRVEEERQILRQQLLQAQKMESIGTLAGGIAHDFNNLLQGILGSAALASQQVEKGSELFSLMETILQSAERGRTLSKQLLTFSRPKQPELQTINLNQIVAESLNILRPLIPATVEIHSRLEPQPWPVRGDLAQLQQVLINLCLNARDALPEGGRITICTENRDLQSPLQGEALPGGGEPLTRRCAVLHVRDNGTGIPEHLLDRIFDPFFTTKEVGRGSGLGLAVAYGIVRNHQGWIKVQSQEGGGSLFTVFLPALHPDHTDPAEPGPAGSRSHTAPSLGGNELLLLVDDEKIVRELARRILEQYGYRILTAQNGLEALRTYQEKHQEIDLVLLDLAMPGMSGLECARKMRELNRNVRIILSSGFAPDFNEGSEVFVPKPYQPEELVRAVRSVLDGATSARL